MRTYKFHWVSGPPDTCKGNDAADALMRLDYGGGAVAALAALDFWEEIRTSDEPVEETLPFETTKYVVY